MKARTIEQYLSLIHILKEVQKIDGLVSFTPVQEIPVELRLGEYTMNTVFQAADLAELHMKGNGPDKIQVGNTPVLLIGKNALSSMTDGNGRRTVSYTHLFRLQTILLHAQSGCPFRPGCLSASP